MNIQETLKTAVQLLSESTAYLETNPSLHARQLDSEVLLALVLKKPRTFLKAWPEIEVTSQDMERFLSLIKKRAQNYPGAYLVGEQEFWSLTLEVNESVLIPRPETECLVEFLLNYFSTTQKPLTGLDLGTGSGAIAIALASENKEWQLLATDVSADALRCAKGNAEKYGLKNISFITSHWFKNIPQQEFDFIISNPPYVEEHAPELIKEAIRFEPRIALCSGEDGLDAIKIICKQSIEYLKANAPLMIEHGYQQAEDVKSIFENAGFFQVKCYKDYSQLDRYTVGFKP